MSSRRLGSARKRRPGDLEYLFLRTVHTSTLPNATPKDIFHPKLNAHEIINGNYDDASERSLKEKIAVTADSFTDKHKKVMKSLRREMGLHENNFDEAIRVLEAPTRPMTSEESTTEKHRTMLASLTTEVFLGGSKETFASRLSETSVITYDYMSGIWNMLGEERKDKNFIISPKGFEFDKEKTKWVPHSDEVVQQIAHSKSKCEEWLTKKCALSKRKISNKLT